MSPKESRASKIVEYQDGRLWFHHKAGTVLVGITLSGLDELGEAQTIELPNEGDDFDKDDVLCDIDGTDGAIKVYAPAAGMIKEVNGALKDDIQILNEDPIDEGWLIKLEIQDDSDLKEYL